MRVLSKIFRHVLFACLTFVGLQQVVAQKLDIESGWKFQKGDSAAYANVALNDAAWKPVSINKDWESQDYANYNGYGWYRKSILIPSTFKKYVDKKYNTLTLVLGKIDDSEQTYFNGKLVGQTGDVVPNGKGAHDVLRIYQLPVAAIRWDKENVIAVRVYDSGGGGGMYAGPYSLVASSSKDFISAAPVLSSENGLYAKGVDIKPALLVNNQAVEAISGTVTCRLSTDDHQLLQVLQQPFEVKKGQQQRVTFSFSPSRPGIYRADFAVQLKGQLDSLTSFQQYGVSVEQIDAGLTRPSDFEAYWAAARKELDAVAPQFKLIKQPDFSTATKDVYLLEMRSLGNALIRGWYSVPKAAGKYPAILKVQGYSSGLMPDTWTNDFAVLSLNIRGHGNSQDDVNPGFPGYLLSGIEDKNTYIYRGAYMDCIRAVDFLVSRPEVDASRIAVEGGSQGGALSFATAALDKRVALCAPDIPFLSDFRQYFEVAIWPGSEFKAYVQQHPEKKWEDVYQVLDYIDIKNLAPWIKVPVLMGVGLLDPVCPPYINFAAFNNITSPKEYRVYPRHGHSTPPEHQQLKMNWIRRHFGMKEEA